MNRALALLGAGTVALLAVPALPPLAAQAGAEPAVLVADPPEQEVITADFRRVRVDGSARFATADPDWFARNFGDDLSLAQQRLAYELTAELRRVLGDAAWADLASDRGPAILGQVAEPLAAAASRVGLLLLDGTVSMVDLGAGTDGVAVTVPFNNPLPSPGSPASAAGRTAPGSQ